MPAPINSEIITKQIIAAPLLSGSIVVGMLEKNSCMLIRAYMNALQVQSQCTAVFCTRASELSVCFTTETKNYISNRLRSSCKLKSCCEKTPSD